jgi:negative regulator of flagellin synthesis FlgM
MKVSHPTNSPPQGSEAAAAKQAGRSSPAHSAKETAAHSKAEVDDTPDANTEISAKSKEFAHAKSVAAAAPDVREDRVNELKRKIADGHYHVDNQAVADRLVEDHLRMPESHHGAD